MIRIFAALLLAALLLAVPLLAVPLLAASPLEGPRKPFMGEPVMEVQQVFASERFPNVVVSLKGTVIATFGSKNVRARRSEDGGKTWGEEIAIGPGIHGGGTTVDEVTGDILAFVEEAHPPAPLTVYRSKDDGKTWVAEPVVITPDAKGHSPSMHMNDHGITLRHEAHKGRLIRPSRYYGARNHRSEWPNHYTNAIYSDDRGKTWTTSAPFPENGTGEACIVELADGSLYYNSRIHWDGRPKFIHRRSARSHDGGATWVEHDIVEALPDGQPHRSYGCMGGLTRLPVAGKDILIYSNLDTQKPRRERVSVWGSFDGGRTWPVKRLVFAGDSAYSALNAGRPGTASEGWIYLHFEAAGSKVARFNLSWLLAGEATGDGELPAE
jgi:sialidase-1